MNDVLAAPRPAAPPPQMNDVDAQRGPSAKKGIKERALSQARLGDGVGG